MPGLTNGTAYTVSVRAQNEDTNGSTDGWGEWSAPSLPEIPAGVPDPVAAPQAQRVDSDLGKQVRVTWNIPAGNGDDVDRYELRTFENGSPLPPVTINSGTQVEFTKNDASDGRQYSFQVVAFNKAGASEPSATSAPVLSYRKPNAPSGVSATPGDRQATVSFTRPYDGGKAIDSYEVRINGALVRAVGADTTVVIDGLNNGTDYTFEVRANNGYPSGWSSPPSNSVRPFGPPAAPALSVAREGSSPSQRVRFSWSSPGTSNGAAVTKVQTRHRKGGGGWTDWADRPRSDSVVVSGNYNQTIRMQARAVNEAGQISGVVEKSRKTDARPASITLEWTNNYFVGQPTSGSLLQPRPVPLGTWSRSQLHSGGQLPVRMPVRQRNLRPVRPDWYKQWRRHLDRRLHVLLGRPRSAATGQGRQRLFQLDHPVIQARPVVSRSSGHTSKGVL